jgi:hypothetical protein
MEVGLLHRGTYAWMNSSLSLFPFVTLLIHICSPKESQWAEFFYTKETGNEELRIN